jgi:hypothetical protein
MSDRSTRRHPQGRPSKGERHTQSIRFPVALYAVIDQARKDAGYDNVNDFVVDVVDRAYSAGLFPGPAGQMRLPASA